jgi:hypothetical protein
MWGQFPRMLCDNSLKSLSSSFWCFWDCIDEVFSLIKKFAAPHLCMVESGPLKGLGGRLLDDVWDNLFLGFWSNCPLNGCLFDCPPNDIVGILDAKKPKDFPSTNY